jgi:hypothetical protein
MKFVFLLAIGGLLINNYCLPQNNCLNLGVTLGPNLVNYDVNNNDPSIRTKRALGYSAGVCLKYSINDNFSLSTGIRRISKGYKTVINYIDHNTSASGTLHWSNIEFPLEISFHKLSVRNMNVEFILGCTYDLLKHHDGYIEGSYWFYYQRDEFLRFCNYSVYFKAGIIKSICKGKHLAINLSYHREFVPVLHTYINLFDDNGNSIREKNYFFKGNYFSLELGYFLPIRKQKINP